MITPRWEWRTFGDLPVDAPELAALRAVTPEESDEAYLLSLRSDASVKLRADLLDVKELQEVDGHGLELWRPTAKTPCVVDVATLAGALAALRAGDELRVVPVHKTRHRSVLDGCLVEYTEIAAGGATTATVAAESPDPDLVVRTVDRLGLAGRRNTCVAQGLRHLVGFRSRRFVVLDVGTNSVKVVVGERDDGEGPRVELDTAVATRLGAGLVEHGGLTEPAVHRTVDAVAGLLDDAGRCGPVEVAAVGTAGLRQAPNRGLFLEALRARTGVVVEVISGAEEARLAYRAAVSTLPIAGGRLLVFDSGGGSSQFTTGTRDRIDEQFSLDLGAVRIAERFGLDGPVSRETVDAALVQVVDELARVAARPRPDAVIAIGGTATNLAAVTHGLVDYDPDRVHGTRVDLAEIDRQIELYRTRTADARRAIPGLQPARAEVILAGACIVRSILLVSGQDAVTVSDRGLRHGVLAERFGPGSDEPGDAPGSDNVF